MFREKYVKDNELITPDNAFLDRLKESVMQEDETIHITGYAEVDAHDDFGNVGRENDNVVQMPARDNKKSGWGKFVAVAACFVFVCTGAYMVGKSGALNGEGLSANMEAVLTEATTIQDNASSSVGPEKETLVDELHHLFSTGNARIYEIDSYRQDMGGIEYLQEKVQEYRQLDMKERDAIIHNFLNDQYKVVDTTEGMNSPVYYIAEFDNRTSVIFAIDSDGSMYIVEMTGIQNMACR